MIGVKGFRLEFILWKDELTDLPVRAIFKFSFLICSVVVVTRTAGECLLVQVKSS